MSVPEPYGLSVTVKMQSKNGTTLLRAIEWLNNLAYWKPYRTKKGSCLSRGCKVASWPQIWPDTWVTSNWLTRLSARTNPIKQNTILNKYWIWWSMQGMCPFMRGSSRPSTSGYPFFFKSSSHKVTSKKTREWKSRSFVTGKAPWFQKLSMDLCGSHRYPCTRRCHRFCLKVKW